MGYKNEQEMYPDVIIWLEKELVSRFPKSQVEVHDTHQTTLNLYIARKGLQSFFDSQQWQTYEIQVDITGFVRSGSQPHLIFVECKLPSISLMHLSQLLGYSRVALPDLSILLSPNGIGESLVTLISTYGRVDVLEYHYPQGSHARRIILATWDKTTQTIDRSSLLPSGYF